MQTVLQAVGIDVIGMADGRQALEVMSEGATHSLASGS